MSVGLASFCMSPDGFIVGPDAGPDDALEIDATDASPLRPSDPASRGPGESPEWSSAHCRRRVSGRRLVAADDARGEFRERDRGVVFSDPSRSADTPATGGTSG
jgi:hypothetical protein